MCTFIAVIIVCQAYLVLVYVAFEMIEGRKENLGPRRALAWKLVVMLPVLALFIFVVTTYQPPPDSPSPVDEIMVTIDRVVAGDSVTLEALNKALRIGTYPIIDEWCAERGVPKECRQEVIRIVSEKLRTVQVSIDLPEDIRAFALPATPSPK